MATTDGYFPPFPQDTAFPAYAQFSAPPPAGFATAPPAQPAPFEYTYTGGGGGGFGAPPAPGEQMPPLVAAWGAPTPASPPAPAYPPVNWGGPSYGGFDAPATPSHHHHPSHSHSHHHSGFDAPAPGATPYYAPADFPAPPPLTSAYSSPGFGASPGFAASPYPPQSPYSTPGSSMYSPGSSYSLPDSPSSATTRSRARAEHFGERPRAWRPDFSMRGPGLAALLPSLPRRNSTAGIPSFTLNERIRYAALREPPVVYDLRHDLSRIQLRELKRPVTNYDLTRYVTEPPMAHMRLYHPRLPWYVDVNTPGQAGATMYDVFTVLARVLLSRVKDHDLYNAEVLNEDRARITQAWKERCQYDDRAMAQGVLKVDFLTRDCIFIGLAKGRDGMFEIKTRKV